MLNRIPEFIDPVQLADKRGVVQGEITVQGMARLADLLLDHSSTVNVALFFSREGKLPFIEGQIKTSLQLKCQSCLQALPWVVSSTVKLGIVNSIDQANRLPEEYEPLLVEQERIALRDLIEDEILLALPVYPKHEHACFQFASGQEDLKAQPTSVKNPFSILAHSEIYNGSTKK